MEFTGKSIVLKQFGGYEQLKIQKCELPKLENLVEIEVHYCGLNFADIYTRKGLMPIPLPFIMGIECCGIIKRLGFESDTLKVGDKVICYNYKGGMYSDIIRIPGEYCYILPSEVDFIEGACLFVNYMTAYLAVIEVGNLRPNQNIFIPSLAGGTGWAATQIARTIPNVKIYGTISQGKQTAIEQNGVEKYLVTNAGEITPESLKALCPEGFDLALDTQSGSSGAFLSDHLKPLGKIVMLGNASSITDERKFSLLSMFWMWWNQAAIRPFDLIMNNRCVAGLHLGIFAEAQPERTRKIFGALLELLRDGKIKPKVHSVLKFESVVEATKLLADRSNIGKVVLEVSNCK